MTEPDLRERFSRLAEPAPLDVDEIVRSATGRKTRRDLFRLGGAAVAVAAVSGLTVAGWQHLPGRTAVPAGPASPAPSSGAPTINSAAGWPSAGEPKAGELYRVSGNLGFMLVAGGWEWWSLDAKTPIAHGAWNMGTPTQASLGSAVTAGTESVGGRQHCAVLLPSDAENVLLTWAQHRDVALVIESKDLPSTTGHTLYHWSEPADEIKAKGDFLLVFTMRGDSNATNVTLRLR